METYDGDNCEGEVKIYRALMYNNRNWTFQTVWDDKYRKMDCNPDSEDIIRNNASCSWSNCICDSDDCKQYFNVGQCIKDFNNSVSNKLVYQKVNYNEQSYCTFNEGYYLVSDDVPLGLTIYKKDYCYRDIAYIGCDLYNIGIFNCSDHSSFALFPSETIVVHNEECGYSEIMFGGSPWWDHIHRKNPLFLNTQKSPSENIKSNSNSNSNKIINQYLIIIIGIVIAIIAPI